MAGPQMAAPAPQMAAPSMKKGGFVKAADGVAKKGKTKATQIKMANGGSIAPTAGDYGSSGFRAVQGMQVYYGGGGGGGGGKSPASGASGGVGGAGAYGCGGGGGGGGFSGATLLGQGGQGGDGLVIITAW